MTFLGPLALLFSGKIDFTADYRTANRESAQLAPDPREYKDAIIQIYSALAFNWRGLFAVHTWIAVKPKDASHYVVYQVIGWRLLHKLPPLAVMSDLPDRNWFNQKPQVLVDIRGKAAEDLIPKIIKAAENYPDGHQYLTWPGPNSNTFTAYIARSVPELGVALPSNAIGKDFLIGNTFFAQAPSGTGYQFSFYGLLGLLLSKKEGLEVNVLGLVYGLNPYNLSVKLPGFGEISFLPRGAKHR